MGTVWGARHVTLGSPVALKFMSKALVEDSLALTRFSREAEAAARIRSPHVVQVLDHGVERGTPYIIMEWLEGEDLGTRLRRERRLPMDQLALLAAQAARALGAAHEVGVIHRDLKPGNIFLSRSHGGEEVVKLLDFGVAKVMSPVAHATTEATATGMMVGTPDYMSPEQVRSSKEIDHRTDLWALGVILYLALTGHKPFKGGSLGEVILRICTAPLVPPSQLVPGLSPAVDLFFARACARDLTERFQSAAELSASFMAVTQSVMVFQGVPPSGRDSGTPSVNPALIPGVPGHAGMPSSVSGGIAGGGNGMRDLPSGQVIYVPSPTSRGPSPITALLFALIFLMLVLAIAQEHIQNALRLLKTIP
ncbi:Hypothetical protein CAP_3283 [Chondromyces apiculatus DSM 436]|uniref:Protein kinase domain-containing protein n=2 Tax=Chondromyces apiculatus TaxID=51 RepID=A0A017T9R4_9BACT|nr:Hypothetical protein CAP_3283 [Chondromyces apiculatus DSM 436]